MNYKFEALMNDNNNTEIFIHIKENEYSYEPALKVLLGKYSNIENIPVNPYPLFDEFIKEGSTLSSSEYSTVYDFIKWVVDEKFDEFKSEFAEFVKNIKGGN